MENRKETPKMDPDYESYNSALELSEEEDKHSKLMKVKKIIEEEFNEEIKRRWEQIEQIELQLCKVRKLQHLLRYVSVMSYYNKKELEYNGSEEETPLSDVLAVPDKQSRIHPAVKKLLGNNLQNLNYLYKRDKRKTTARNNVNSAAKSHKAPETAEPENKRIKLESENSPSPETKSLNTDEGSNLDSMRKRKRTKHTIVVGNVSKWMPSSEDDNLTHKWMVYVRGPKESPDVSHFIDKIVFYLHPSYKPHDVVEVGQAPFHLSRRGWGEFPVRVQIFFKITLNKPVDVVHNIKLDKTYSGRQTLGNETIVEVFLYDDDKSKCGCELESVPSLETTDVKIEQVVIKEQNDVEELQNTPSTSYEHNYCSENNSSEEKGDNNEISIVMDHSYCLPPGHEKLPTIKEEQVIENVPTDNSLIYGLDKSYLESNADEKTNKKMLIPLNKLNNLIQLSRKDIKFNNTKIIVFGKRIDGLLTDLPRFEEPQKNMRASLLINKNEQNSFKLSLPRNKFKNMGEALPYMFKRLPLISELVNNLNYKRLYPFTAPSLKEFVSWNIGKKRSSEWSRARIIRNILIAAQIHEATKWNTKAILMYGRSHGYTPLATYGLFSRKSEEKQMLLSCYATSSQNMPKFDLQNSIISEAEVTVNVDSDTDIVKSPKKYNNSSVDISDPNLRLECGYVRQAALDCGIVLKPEEIDEGVVTNGAERMILEAVKCLADNLLRRALNFKICQKTPNSTVTVISKEDIQSAIDERPDMLSLLQFKNKRRDIDFFS